MAIIGLTSKKDFKSERSLPRLAKFRKGAPKPENGNRPGQDLKYFRVDFEPQYTYLSESFQDIYGSEPREFNNVRLLSETTESAFPTFYESWTATALQHRCDGETQIQYLNSKTGKYSHEPIACVGGEPDLKCGCSKIGRLSFVLPDFTYATGEIGQFAIETHSTHDIIAIWNQLMFLEQQFGHLAGIPFTIGRMDKEVSYPKKDGTRGMMTRSLIYIKPEQDFMKQYFLGSFDSKSDYALPEHIEETPQLPETVTEDYTPTAQERAELWERIKKDPLIRERYPVEKHLKNTMGLFSSENDGQTVYDVNYAYIQNWLLDRPSSKDSE